MSYLQHLIKVRHATPLAHGERCKQASTITFLGFKIKRKLEAIQIEKKRLGLEGLNVESLG